MGIPFIWRNRTICNLFFSCVFLKDWPLNGDSINSSESNHLQSFLFCTCFFYLLKVGHKWGFALTQANRTICNLLLFVLMFFQKIGHKMGICINSSESNHLQSFFFLENANFDFQLFNFWTWKTITRAEESMIKSEIKYFNQMC